VRKTFVGKGYISNLLPPMNLTRVDNRNNIQMFTEWHAYFIKWCLFLGAASTTLVIKSKNSKAIPVIGHEGL
jgi:hypothetical protein